MIDTITKLAPQQVPVEGASEGGKQAASADFSFTKALTDVIGDGKAASAEPVPTEPQAEAGDVPVALSELVGAVQVAMAMPVPSLHVSIPGGMLPAAVESASQAIDGDSIVPATSSDAQPAGLQVASVNGSPTTVTMPASAMPTEATLAPTGPVSVPVSAEDAAEAVPQGNAGVETVEVPSVQTDDIATDTKPVGSQTATSDRPKEAQTTETPSPLKTAPTVPTRTPVETTPVQWRFEASSHPEPVEGLSMSKDAAVSAVETLVAGSGAKPTGDDIATDTKPVATGKPDGALGPEVAWVSARSDRPIVQSQAAETVQPADGQTATSDRPKETQTTETPSPLKTAPAVPTRTPIETTPVQWRFEASSHPEPVEGLSLSKDAAVSAVETLVAGSGAKPTGKDGGGTPDQGLSNPQIAAPMGQQFTAQLQGAAARPELVEGANLHARVIDQVIREVSLHRIDGRSDIVVKLNPPDLGALRLQITQDATGMTTHIQAGSSQVRGLLEAHMPLLIDSLAKAGLRMDSVSVSVGTSFNAFAGNASQRDAQPNSNQAFAQYTPGSGIGGVQAMAGPRIPSWGTSGQVGYSWLA